MKAPWNHYYWNEEDRWVKAEYSFLHKVWMVFVTVMIWAFWIGIVLAFGVGCYASYESGKEDRIKFKEACERQGGEVFRTDSTSGYGRCIGA